MVLYETGMQLTNVEKLKEDGFLFHLNIIIYFWDKKGKGPNGLNFFLNLSTLVVVVVIEGSRRWVSSHFKIT